MLVAALAPARPGTRVHSRTTQAARCCASVDGAVVAEDAAAVSSEALAQAKARLISAVAGLDRGASARPSDVNAVSAAVTELEALAPRASLDSSLDSLSGLWRLVYSSTFAGQPGGSQGFTGVPGAGTPLRLGPVFQRVQASKRTLDNIVELTVPGPFFLGSLTVVATLSHSLEVLSDSRVRVNFQALALRGRGVRGARPLTLPSPLSLLPALEAALPPNLRGGEFDTTFCDAEARVSRGDRGELRVFVRA
jgi:hypothetical protein